MLKSEMRVEKALQQEKERQKKNYEYRKNKYDYQSIALPAGTKDAIQARGETVNGLVNRLVKEYLEKEP
ncbi:MAG: hypothetical protein K6B15_10335 [Parasporobacterium sp.]|nr:hypothetical protein [Parasporobacterium sp.]